MFYFVNEGRSGEKRLKILFIRGYIRFSPLLPYISIIYIVIPSEARDLMGLINKELQLSTD
jgi:hypothetical protein